MNPRAKATRLNDPCKPQRVQSAKTPHVIGLQLPDGLRSS
jgi:hypothetical protein